MSSIFQGLLNAAGQIKVGAGPVVSYFRALPLNAAGEVVVGAGPVVRFDQGIPYNASGQVVGLQATEPTGYGPGATPYGPNGELETVLAVPAYFHQGVPYDVNGVYASSGAAGSGVIVAKNFSLGVAVISSTSVGYRTSPLAGSLTPDQAYAGGTINLVQATDDDEFRIGTVGNTPFPGITGNLAVQVSTYIGPNRLVMSWDGSSFYAAVVPGIYVELSDLVGGATALRLSGAPA
jgi:hypothetical protein